MNLNDKVKAAGVVGAGGAGFPTHVKLAAKNVEYYLANGAECEPLMHKDRELMTHFTCDIVDGLNLAADCISAPKRTIGLKKKHTEAIQSLKKECETHKIDIHLFDDYYPAGDEYELVYAITKRLIPPQGIPLDVNCVVNNVETLHNIAKASKGKPVTHTFMTIAGAVKHPVTTWVPVGMRAIDVLELAGGPLTKSYGIMESGLMMGKLVQDVNQPVSKTTGGLIVLPEEHDLIQRYNKPQKHMDRIGHSACDQCMYCTELCPRYLLGYDVQPHRVMRSLCFTAMGPELWNQYALLCCQCGLCTLYACPEALYPREACVRGMNDLRAIEKGKWEGDQKPKVHPMKEPRRVPLKMLTKKLGVSKYTAEAVYKNLDIQPEKVLIPLKQHVGSPAQPVVRAGDNVSQGQLLAQPTDGQLGASVHASISGRIADIQDNMIIIEA